MLTEANENLSNIREMIVSTVKTAEEYVFQKLKIDWDIDLLVTNRLYDIIIPEDGVGGRTRTSNFIKFAINEKGNQNLISEMVAHELCHAARWGKNDKWTNSPFNCIISEGTATYLETEFIENRKEKTIFIKTILERTNDENEQILKNLRNQLDSNYYDYDYDTIFFKGNDELPRWSGYSLEYYLVKKYLEKTNKTIEDAFTDKYTEFKITL